MTINCVAVVVLLVISAVIFVEGWVDTLSAEEELDLQRQLTIQNKPPVTTIHTPWGDIYDCIEFYKQPAFDHPLLKNRTIEMRQEVVSTRSHLLEMLTNQVDECPKGTVPIRRITRKDLIKAKYLSSNAAPDKQYRAGISYKAKEIGESIYGASGLFNVWAPSVSQDQFSSTEIAVQSGSPEELNVIRFGWTVDQQLYGDSVPRGFAYWTGDGGRNTGCYNTICSGFVQTHDKYTLDLPIVETSILCGTQIALEASIYLDRQSGKCYLTVLNSIQIGYWPIELFPAFAPGATYIYWGGRVKAGKNGITPPMGSGQLPNENPSCSGFFQHLKYIDMNNQFLQPKEIEYTIDCPEHYAAEYYPDDNILHFGGYGGSNCTSS
ncbi:hypothetical protein MKW98_004198 [Papaver atlanticum]|uniref:Neprosin PEP catalytic domain-containing protein n=1 Tax=Papaver atlanticum TaxID=357466 RepID=A0AAD4T8X0_9MAGN|nr:hypothetical protein MKW98_004198 [Papaver atlanticum]